MGASGSGTRRDEVQVRAWGTEQWGPGEGLGDGGMGEGRRESWRAVQASAALGSGSGEMLSLALGAVLRRCQREGILTGPSSPAHAA